MFEIPCIFCHFSTTRFPFKTPGILGVLRCSLRSCIYTVTFTEMNILRSLKRLAATKGFSGKQKFVKFRKLFTDNYSTNLIKNREKYL